MVCRNPLLKAERARKREELLQATERLLDPIVAATRRLKRPLTGRERIALRVGRVLDKYKMAKHFHLDITDHSFGYTRNPDSIAREAALDGLYVVRTSLPENQLDAHRTVHAYKSLSRVERAFRSFKTVDLKVRPVYHRAPERVRAHVLLCMLAYYVEWHMRQRLAPLLFDDHDPAQRTALLSGGASQDLARSSEQGSHQTHRGRLARSTASARCSTTWPPSSKTASSRDSPAPSPSTCSLAPLLCNVKPSNSSAFHSNVPSSRALILSLQP